MSYIIQLGAYYVCNDDIGANVMTAGATSPYPADARRFVKFSIARNHAVNLAGNNVGCAVKVRNRQTLALAMDVTINETQAR